MSYSPFVQIPVKSLEDDDSIVTIYIRPSSVESIEPYGEESEITTRAGYSYYSPLHIEELHKIFTNRDEYS